MKLKINDILALLPADIQVEYYNYETQKVDYRSYCYIMRDKMASQRLVYFVKPVIINENPGIRIGYYEEKN